MSLQRSNTFRKYHRLLGFFLAGIMLVYATSGSLLIFRTTDFLKFDQIVERQLESGLQANQLGGALRMRGFNIISENATTIEFNNGSYDRTTGIATYQTKDYPVALQKMVHMHKATTNSPLYYLNLFFGASLLFFSISSFFMFLPKAPQYRTGLKVATAGAAFALFVVLF